MCFEDWSEGLEWGYETERLRMELMKPLRQSWKVFGVDIGV